MRFAGCLILATVALSVACDRGADARAVSTPSPVVGQTKAPSTRHDQGWPAPAAEPGRAFTAGIVDYRPVPRQVALLTDVRAARHEDFDRVVFELGAGEPPGFHLEYVDRPVRKCGSGEPTPIAGDAWLEVRLEPANAHTAAGAATIKDRERKLELGVLRELEQTCDFEAQVVWVLGLSRPNPYRVLTLDDPLRLVVDVKH